MSAQSTFEVTTKPVVAFMKVSVGIGAVNDGCAVWGYVLGLIIGVIVACIVNRLIICDPRRDVRNLVCGKSNIKPVIPLVFHRRERPVRSFESFEAWCWIWKGEKRLSISLNKEGDVACRHFDEPMTRLARSKFSAVL